ncbi:MAG: hypothetical protein P4L53_22140 [Candidatus Obscuribacterales bacterium]|nr:hypothetical protein [Candidatus Obscuribacterales bacterium]
MKLKEKLILNPGAGAPASGTFKGNILDHGCAQVSVEHPDKQELSRQFEQAF